MTKLTPSLPTKKHAYVYDKTHDVITHGTPHSRRVRQNSQRHYRRKATHTYTTTFTLPAEHHSPVDKTDGHCRRKHHTHPYDKTHGYFQRHTALTRTTSPNAALATRRAPACRPGISAPPPEPELRSARWPEGLFSRRL